MILQKQPILFPCSVNDCEHLKGKQINRNNNGLIWDDLATNQCRRDNTQENKKIWKFPSMSSCQKYPGYALKFVCIDVISFRVSKDSSPICQYQCPTFWHVDGISTVMIRSFRRDRPGQTVQIQSDQGLHCLPFHLHRLDSLLYGRATVQILE